MDFFYFCEECLQNFGKDCIEPVDHFWKYVHFHNTNFANP
jgi:hypothetical protein